MYWTTKPQTTGETASEHIHPESRRSVALFSSVGVHNSYTILRQTFVAVVLVIVVVVALCEEKGPCKRKRERAERTERSETNRQRVKWFEKLYHRVAVKIVSFERFIGMHMNRLCSFQCFTRGSACGRSLKKLSWQKDEEEVVEDFATATNSVVPHGGNLAKRNVHVLFFFFFSGSHEKSNSSFCSLRVQPPFCRQNGALIRNAGNPRRVFSPCTFCIYVYILYIRIFYICICICIYTIYTYVNL